MKRILMGLLGASVLALGACSGDDDDESPTAQPTSGDGAATSVPTTASTGAVAIDTDFGDDGVLTVPLSANGHDRFMAVAFGEDGSFYATGFVVEGGDAAMVLAKFNEDGSPDESFADDGRLVVNVASGGKTAELSRNVAVQADGKIVFGGPIEHDTSATGDAAKDLDIAVVRANEDGTLDGDFGDEGIAVVSLNTGRQVSESSFVGDNAWGIGALEDGRVVVFGSTLAAGEGRTDSDLVLFALTEDGELDESFGEDGKVVVDLGGESLNPRNLLVQGDMILATGYGNIGGVVQPLTFRVNDAGELDESFGDGGIATAVVLPGVAESYAVAAQGDSYISAGYGRGADSTEKVDLIVDRWSASGELDTSFGEGGVTRLDLAGQDDRARNMIVLPDGSILAVGSGKLTEPEIDAMIALFDEDGALVEDFEDGGHFLVNLGGPGDAFFGVALAPDGRSVIVAGYKGVAADSGNNDDAVLVRLTID